MPEQSPAAVVTMDELVRDLLRLDPEVLASMSQGAPSERHRPKGAVSQSGLNAFLRKVLELYLALADDGAAVVHLKT